MRGVTLWFEFASSGALRGQEPKKRSLENVADPKQRRELLEDSARGIVRRGRDLAPGKGSDVIQEIHTQHEMFLEFILDTAAHSRGEFPLVNRVQRGDTRNRLRIG